MTLPVRTTVGCLVTPALSLALTLAPSTTAAAAPMEHHDLASLWHLADHVVEAVEISHQQRLADWNTTTTYEVTAVVGGDLQVGQQIEVYDDPYRLEVPPWTDWANPANAVVNAVAPRDPGVFLFLVPARPRLVADGPGGGVTDDAVGCLQLVPSGMRIMAGGGVYRFEQWSNPGGYAPVPQGVDPADVTCGRLEPFPRPLTRAQFLVELAEAAGKAARAEAALAILDPAQRNAALLALLPSPRTFPAVERPTAGGFAADALSREIKQAVGASGDLEAMLDAMSRDVVPDMRMWDAREFFGPDPTKPQATQARDELVAVALDPARSTAQRHAALWVLEANGRFGDLGEPAWIERLSPLLADADPYVRAETVRVFGRMFYNARDEARRAVVARLGDEEHPEVLVAIAEVTRNQDRKARDLDPWLRANRPLVLAVRPGPDEGLRPDELYLGYAMAIPHHQWTPTLTLTAVITAEDGAERRVEGLFRSGSVGQDTGHGLFRFPLDPRLPPGTYTVVLQGHTEPTESHEPPADGVSQALTITIDQTS